MRYSPASAGTADHGRRGTWPRRVHPRCCGGYSATSRERIRPPGTIPTRAGQTERPGAPMRDIGASPRARRRTRAPVFYLPAGRFIPARAGQVVVAPPVAIRGQVHPRACGKSRATLADSARSDGGRAHPRTRGETARALAFASRRAGSSPLVRGSPDHHSRLGWNKWFIPARAGNTSLTFS